MISDRFVHDAFCYWESGSEEVAVNPPVHSLDGLLPFVVRVGNDNIIPINVLVYSVDEAEAAGRVLQALKKCAELDHRGDPDAETKLDHRSYSRAHDFLRKLESGEYEVKVSSFDTKRIVQVDWGYGCI